MKMTENKENEAIKVLENPTKHIKQTLLDGEITICYSSDMVKAFEIAIQALKDIQPYREMGTVEELQAMIVENNTEVER